MKHWVSLEWDEQAQRLTITGGAPGTLARPGRPTRVIVERDENEPAEMLAVRIGQAVIKTAKGEPDERN